MLKVNRQDIAFQTKHSAAFDLCSTDTLVLEPGQSKTIGTGMRIIGISLIGRLALWLGLRPYFAVVPRSGYARKHGVTLLNSPGIIDADYRGEWTVTLINHSAVPFYLEAGQRCAQAMLKISLTGSVRSLPRVRGAGGHGSTGV